MKKYLVPMTFFSYPEQQKARKYCCAMKQFYLLMIQQMYLMSQPRSQGFFRYCFQNHTFMKEVVKHFCETILCVCRVLDIFSSSDSRWPCIKEVNFSRYCFFIFIYKPTGEKYFKKLTMKKTVIHSFSVWIWNWKK